METTSNSTMERSSCLTAYWLLAVPIPPSLVPSLCGFAAEVGQAPWDSSPPSAKQCYARDVAKCKHRHGPAHRHSWAPASPQDLPDQSPPRQPFKAVTSFAFSVMMMLTFQFLWTWPLIGWIPKRNWTLKGSIAKIFVSRLTSCPQNYRDNVLASPQTIHEGIYFPTAFQPLLI